jgi:two-component system, NarL family, response regulator LiaR
MTTNPIMKIRVFIVDDHEMVRSGLAAFLSVHRDLQVAGEASTGEEAVAKCRQIQPDVVLMDMILPGMDGAATTAEIRRLCPHTQVIALTSFKEANLVNSALQAGAISYLYKNVSAGDLASAIRAAAVGQPTIAPDALHALLRSSANNKQPGYDLTEREMDVLRYMVKGMNNQQIADELIVSRSTVKAHVSSILSKLSVTTRTEAVALAIRTNILQP